MTPFDERIVKMIRQVMRDTGRPARSVALSVELGTSLRSMQLYLSRLEKMGICERPLGPKRGYALAVAYVAAPVVVA